MTDGHFVGRAVGRTVGRAVGRVVGLTVGRAVGRTVGHEVDRVDGDRVDVEVNTTLTMAACQFVGLEGQTSEDAVIETTYATPSVLMAAPL